MKEILISIQPKWCYLIESGKKTVEVRKTRPKLETPFKVYIYETLGEKIKLSNCVRGTIYRGCGKVIGEFICDSIGGGYYGDDVISENSKQKTCLTATEIADYIEDKYAYFWHISNLVIYDKPRELSEFYTLKKCNACNGGYESTACIYDENCKVPVPLKRPPQSWCYVEVSK